MSSILHDARFAITRSYDNNVIYSFDRFLLCSDDWDGHNEIGTGLMG